MPHYITTHNSSGQAIFDTSIPTDLHKISMRPDAPADDPIGINILYTSHIFRTNLSTNADLTQYAHDRTNGLPPGTITPKDGFAVTMITLGPGKSPNHRTMTLDVLYLIEGVIELTLDSGEMKVVKAGDTVVQRVTMHQWNNITPEGGVARLFGVAVASEETVKVGGKELSTEWNF